MPADPPPPTTADAAFNRLWNAGFFRQFVEASDDVVAIIDSHGAFAYVNPAGERLLGTGAAGLAGADVVQHVHPDDRARSMEAFRSWFAAPTESPVSLENRLVGTDGETHTMLWTVQACRSDGGEVVGFATTGRDISELRARGQALQLREAHYHALLQGMLDAVVTIDDHGTVLDASRSVEEVFGWIPDELRGQNIRLLMPEPHRSQHDEYLQRYRETGNTWILGTTREFECVRRGGETIHCELSVSRIDVPGTDAPVFCGSFRDVTARKAAEHALADSERRFRAIFDQEFQFVGLLAPDGSVLEANQAALQAGALKREQVLGSPLWDLPWWHGPEDKKRLREAVSECAGGMFVRFEVSMLTPNRGRRAMDFSLKPLLDETGTVTLLLPEGRDITEIKRAQERETAMLRAFAAIGESASVLAHEIKNPITAVNMALRAVSEKLGEDHQATLEGLVGSLRKVEQLMRRTLSYTRPLELKQAPCDLHELLRGAVDQARAMATAAEVEILCSPGDPCPTLNLDAVLIEQAVTNLIHNAIQAVDCGGSVRVWCHLDKELVSFGVDDSGPGIAPVLREEVFRPFVTTRADGTGLGLALTRKIIEAHGGRIEVLDSDLGGARMSCSLPLRN